MISEIILMRNITYIKGLLLVCSAILFLACGTTKKTTASKSNNGITPEAEVKLMSMYIEASMKQSQGYFAEALSDYAQVIRFQPKHAPSHYNSGKIYLENLNQPEKALEHAQQAVTLDEMNPFYYDLLAQAYIKLNKQNEAITVLQKASKKFPDETDFQPQLVDLLLKTARYDDAIEVLSKLETKSGMMIQAVAQKKDIYRFQKKWDLAIAENRKLINATRDNAPFYYDLHDLYLSQGKQMEAMRTLEELLVQHPNDPVANFKLVDYYNATGNPQKADELMYKNFDNPQLNLDAKVGFLVRAIQSPSFQNNVGMVQTMVAKLSAQNPKSAMVASLRGDVYASLNKPDSARYYFKKATRLEDTNPKVWEAILRLDMQLNQNDSLLQDSERALETYPNNPAVVYYNGIAYYNKKDYKNTTRVIEKFLKFDVKDPVMLTQAHSILGESYHRLGDHAKSDKAYERGMEIDPSNMTILNNYAYYLSLRGEKLDYALSLSDKTVKMMPNSPTYADTYGWILYQLGRYQEAQTYLQKAYSMTPSAETADHLGDVFFRLGNPDRAVELWREAKSKGLNNPNLDQKINNRKL